MSLILLEDLSTQLALSKKLASIDALKFYDSDEPESWRLVHDLSEIEESFHKIFLQLTPLLLQETNPESLQDILEDIGDQIRHACYHINNSGYLRSWATSLPTGD